MKTRITSRLIPLCASTLLMASAALVTGCSQQPKAIPEATGGMNTGAGAASNGNAGSNTQGANVGSGGDVRSTGAGGGYQTGSGSSSANADAALTLENLNNPNSLLSKRIIYFDYNQATVRPEYQGILDAHTKLLAQNPQVNARLEGHADERGTREYNVALSEERAKAVQWSMRGQGVKSSQTEIVAYGEERPAKVGDGEKSWAQNRRVEIKYPGR